jgi:hypothetical protein
MFLNRLFVHRIRMTAGNGGGGQKCSAAYPFFAVKGAIIHIISHYVTGVASGEKHQP